ncbi:MAG: hypothetical protein HQK92_06460, partial [Nitrospirae bacterium]|nr:hypothetical protein [Nitrospirota bacterium]
MVHKRNLRRLFIVTLALITVFLAFSWVRIIYLFPINPDGGDYLSTMERISDGLRPYVDIKVHYPPAIYFYFLFFKKFFGGGDVLYRFALFIVEMASALMLSLIAKRLFKSTTVSVFCGIVFLFFYLAYDGPWFVIEPFVNFFSLSAVFLLLNPAMAGAFASGVCLLLAVMSKQYGLLALPALSVMLCIKQETFEIKGGLLRGLLFIAGFLSAALLVVHFLNLDFKSFVSQLSGQGYVKAGLLN